MDTKLRSLVKSITWRIAGIFVLGTITWIITGDSVQTTYITATFNIIQVLLYYSHERLWEKTNWGKSVN